MSTSRREITKRRCVLTTRRARAPADWRSPAAQSRACCVLVCVQIYMYVHGYSVSSTANLGIPGSTTTPVSDEEMKTIRELKLAHFCNLGMCHLKQGNLAKARVNCTKALAIDSSNVKALFRRGKCNAGLGALDEAKEDFDGVLLLEPANKEAVRELRALRGAFASHKKKEARKFAGMFDRLADESGEPTSASEAPAAASASSSAVPAASSVGSSAADAAADATDAAASTRALGGGGFEGGDAGDEWEMVEEGIGEPLGPPQPFEPTEVRYAPP